MIAQNQIRCNKCGDEPYSASRHDFKNCKCGAVAVDGGMDYLRRLGNPEDYTDLSYHIPNEVMADCKEAIRWAEETGRNDLGKVLAIVRVLNKYRLYDTNVAAALEHSLNPALRTYDGKLK